MDMLLHSLHRAGQPGRAVSAALFPADRVELSGSRAEQLPDDIFFHMTVWASRLGQVPTAVNVSAFLNSSAIRAPSSVKRTR